MKNKLNKAIIILSVLAVSIGVAIFITMYQDNLALKNQLKNEQSIRVTAKIASDKLIASKIIEDKLKSDKVIAERIIAKRINDKKIADKKIADTLKENQRIEAQRVAKANQNNSTVIIRYTIDGEWITKCNYTNGTTFQLKVGQRIQLRGTFLNGSTERIMYMNGGVFSFVTKKDNGIIKMLAVGGDDITIIPNMWSSENQYTFHVVVSN